MMNRFVRLATTCGLLLLLHTATISSATTGQATTPAEGGKIRRRSNRRLLQKSPCIVTQRSVLFKNPNDHDENSKHVWSCKLQGEDVLNAQAGMVDFDPQQIEELNNDPNIRSGQTTLLIDGTEITEDKKLKLPKGTSITKHLGKKENHHNDNNGNRSGHRYHNRDLNADTAPDAPYKVLAIRVIANDAATTATKAQLSDDIFGTGNDQINLVSRYHDCSYGQLQFEPYVGSTTGGPTITNGVYELTMNNFNINGKTNKEGENAVVTAATTALGNLEEQFDYVMICLPVSVDFFRESWDEHSFQLISSPNFIVCLYLFCLTTF